MDNRILVFVREVKGGSGSAWWKEMGKAFLDAPCLEVCIRIFSSEGR